jgi:2-(3-amino-3-carboxypropyl)histidine synthase
MRILLQFPEGLKQQALGHAKRLEKEGHEVFVSASPTFGACDLALDEARIIKADKLVHFGHCELQKVDFDVEYVEYHIEAPLAMLEVSLEHLKGFNTLCLMTTIQHVHQLKEIKNFYEKNGKKIVISTPNGLAKNPGQLLGCDVGNVAALDKSVDAFVYFGGGIFHPLGALLQTSKPFFCVDPFQGKVERMDSLREAYKKRSKGRVLASLGAKNFGILMSTKNGQHSFVLANALKKRIEAAGLTAVVLVSNTFDFESINNMMEFDAFVNTACPRISIDDGERLRKPLLSASELATVLELRSIK